MFKKILIGVAVIAVVVVAALTGGFFGRFEITRIKDGLPDFTHKAGPILEERVAMADGVHLFTTVSLPKGSGPFPAVLIRSPYAKYSGIMRDSLCGRFVRYGYACAFQDTRGQGESEGDWNPTQGESADGKAALEWLAGQAFQDGNIAMVGPSYLGAVQWSAAAAGLPPEVKTLIPAVTSTRHREVLYQDGMFRHETFTAWASTMRERNAKDENAGAEYQRAIRHRPHNEIDEEIYGIIMPWYQEMISSESPTAPFWQEPEVRLVGSVPERMEIPILMIGGWYDVFLGPQFDDWNRLATQSKSLYVVGPWTHIGGGGSAFDNPNASGGLFQWQVMLPWLEHHLRGKPLPFETGVRTYALREGEWKQRQSWPPKGSELSLFLDQAHHANSCEGGILRAGEPLEASSVSYQYDPLNPVPTMGGSGMLAFILPGFDGAPPANEWQDGMCEREDVLTFLGPVLDKPIRIAGDIKVKLSVSSSAEDTSFTAKLMEVGTDGRAVNIRDSITSLKFRNKAQEPQSYAPGEQVDIEIDFWPIEWVVSAGSQLRLDISSSDFPKFHAHSNKAVPWAEADSTEMATQTILTGTGSALVLSVAAE